MFPLLFSSLAPLSSLLLLLLLLLLTFILALYLLIPLFVSSFTTHTHTLNLKSSSFFLTSEQSDRHAQLLHDHPLCLLDNRLFLYLCVCVGTCYEFQPYIYCSHTHLSYIVYIVNAGCQYISWNSSIGSLDNS